MRMVTAPQLKKIHTLLGELGIMDRKPEIVYGFTNGRTESSRELTLMEAKSLIEYLMGSQERTVVVKRIWHLAYEMNIIVPGDHNEKAMNAAKLDKFCEQRGTVKKALSTQSLKEVKRTARQFEAMYQKYTEKQEALTDIKKLEAFLQAFIRIEDYENASKAKKAIDELTAKITPKRKRAVKTA